jgi:phage shock protein C
VGDGRSREKKATGGGLGEYLGVDAAVVRLVAVITRLPAGIIPFLIGYVVAWLIVPEAPPKTPS